MFCQRCSYARTRRCCNSSTSNQISDTATGYIPVTMSYTFTPTGSQSNGFGFIDQNALLSGQSGACDDCNTASKSAVNNSGCGCNVRY